jgi:hypothetical protein
MHNQYEYLNSFIPALESMRYFQPKELSHEEYMRFHFGSNYLGDDLIKCDYCKINSVKFIGYFNKHICLDCKE